MDTFCFAAAAGWLAVWAPALKFIVDIVDVEEVTVANVEDMIEAL